MTDARKVRRIVARVALLAVIFAVSPAAVHAQQFIFDFGCGPYQRTGAPEIGTAFMFKVVPVRVMAGRWADVTISGPPGWHGGRPLLLKMPSLGWYYFGEPTPVARVGRYTASITLDGRTVRVGCNLSLSRLLRPAEDLTLRVVPQGIEISWRPLPDATAYHVWIKRGNRIVAAGDTARPPFVFSNLRLDPTTYQVNINAANTSLGPAPPRVPQQFLFSHALADAAVPMQKPGPNFGAWIYPVLGEGVSDPTQNTVWPEGWSKANNGFGNRCGIGCPGGRTHLYHPGEDWNRTLVGGDANHPVHAVHEGMIIRAERIGTDGSLGWYVSIRHELPAGGFDRPSVGGHDDLGPR